MRVLKFFRPFHGLGMTDGPGRRWRNANREVRKDEQGVVFREQVASCLREQDFHGLLAAGKPMAVVRALFSLLYSPDELDPLAGGGSAGSRHRHAGGRKAGGGAGHPPPGRPGEAVLEELRRLLACFLANRRVRREFLIPLPKGKTGAWPV